MTLVSPEQLVMTDGDFRRQLAREGFFTDIGCACIECGALWDMLPETVQALYEQDVIRGARDSAKSGARLTAGARPLRFLIG